MPKQQNGLPVTLHSPVCSKMFADEKRAVTCTKTRRVNAFTNMEVRHIFGIVKKYAILLNSCFLSLSRNESASSIYTFSKKLGKRIRTVIVSVLTGYPPLFFLQTTRRNTISMIHTDILNYWIYCLNRYFYASEGAPPWFAPTSSSIGMA